MRNLEDSNEGNKDPSTHSWRKLPQSPIGVVTGSMQRHSLTSQQDVYIVRGLPTSLLGRPAITALQLLQRLDTIKADADPGAGQRQTLCSFNSAKSSHTYTTIGKSKS